MKYLAPRTCTEILHHDNDRNGETTSRPLEEFRSEPAYVLLGDPGAGKTTAFEVESRERGEEAMLIDARRFVRSDLNSHPEWRDKTLFIDGLDEGRAGQSDARTPLDSICNRLEKLGRPSFRISCREADWLGGNDRRNLATVSPKSQVTTLRLDPLTDSDIEHILDAHPGVDDAQDFVSKARETGIEGLLANPQTLKMLADVVGGEEGWPEGRLDTFEKACRQLAEELNEEHVIAERPPPLDQTVDGAGHLCAVQLISGTAGFSLKHNESDAYYPAYDACEYESPALLRTALSTRLFRVEGEGCLTPVHRHIAEFLGARHLAKRICEGLPVRRVISLIAGEDGVVVTELRGLSAWLAAHSRTARQELIKSDPIGVGLYGDIREFSPGEKRKLILSLNREVTRIDYKVKFAAAFVPLASSDMESTLFEVLMESRRDVEHQMVVEFLLQVLQEASPQPGLSQALLDVVSDPSWPPSLTRSALYAFMHNSTADPERTNTLRQLGDDIRTGLINDPGNELLGILLGYLYPKAIPPSQVWDYLNDKSDPHFPMTYEQFWEYVLPNKLDDDDVPELLDSLYERLPAIKPVLESSGAHDLPLKLLAWGLRVHGNELQTPRLYNWLSAGAYQGWEGYRSARDPDDPILHVRAWLEQRPEVQKAVLVEGLIRCPAGDEFSFCSRSVWSSLHGSNLPHDFDLWCLDSAVELDETHPRVAEVLLDHAAGLYQERTNLPGLSHSVLVEHIRGHELLERRLEFWSDLLPNAQHPDSRQAFDDSREGDKRAREQWVDLVRSNVDALRENRALPSLLHDLARAYFGQIPSRGTNINPEQRVRVQLGDDGDLTEAAMTGLRGTIWRDDVPEAEKTIRMRSESRVHYLALPVLAGLDDIERRRPDLLARLDDNQKRKALAFLYCMPGNRDDQWYLDWQDSDPDLVADALVRCAAQAIRDGEESVPALYELDHLAHTNIRAQIVRSATPALLRVFPLRCNLKQIEALDLLLWAAIRHLDRALLLQLIEKKLSQRSMNVAQRIHWLAAGILVAPAKYLKSLEKSVAGKEVRIRQLAAFLCAGNGVPFVLNDLPVQSLKLLVGLLGRAFRPNASDGFVVPTIQESSRVEFMIHQLANRPDQDATRALEALSSDAALRRWHDIIVRARGRQRVIHRDAAFRHPSLQQIRQTLSNQAPANPADLAGLVMDRLCDLAIQIRTGNTDDWRQYWNEDKPGMPATPKHEDFCRDALLSDLRARLPEGVDAQPEGQYAGDKRADIRIAYKNFSVPVEIKKSTHRDLWSAARNQLIAKYTSDPATGGYGIYLVFWTGETEIPGASSGPPPSTAEELRQRLQATLTDDEARKISICMVDVSPTGKV